MDNALNRNSMTFWGLVFYAIMVIAPAGPFAFTNQSARKKATELAMWMNFWQSGDNAYKDSFHTNDRHGVYHYI